MPKIVEERTTHAIESVQDLYDLAQTLDMAEKVDVTLPDGRVSRFPHILNSNTNEEIATVGGRYELVQHPDVVTAFADGLKSVGKELTFKEMRGGDKFNAFIQTGSKLWGTFFFNETVKLGNDDSETSVGVRVRNSLDGSTGIELSLFMYRWACGNGMIFGREEIGGGKRRHTAGANAALVEDFIAGFQTLDDLFGTWHDRIVVAQNKTLSLEEAQETVKQLKLGKDMTSWVTARIPVYMEELGGNVYAVYNAMTDAITHYENGQGRGLSTHRTEQFHAKAAKLLVV